LQVEPFHLRERPAAELAALFAGGWPAFIGADEVAARFLPEVRSAFADLETALLQDDVLVAAGWGVPIAWDQNPDDLPDGYSDALARAVLGRRAGLRPDTFVVCAAQVRPDVGGSGLAVALLEALVEAARNAGLPRVVAPLRPTGKHRYPLTPIEEYATWTRPDGSAFDPWLRTHLRMGAQLIGTSPRSQTFTGTVQQWQEWSGLDLPGDGAYVISGALAPLEVDRAADRGTCTEPAIWVRHR
jgi:GNAT superfamily N-acetyltransferase